jgi:non-ribosomal peptide synthase protein (TIGR01720 family)
LIAVKDRLRKIPRGGIGYGLLRYARNDESARKLAALPQAWVSFNYLGRFDRTLAAASKFSTAPEGAGPLRSDLGRRSHAIEVNALVVGGRLSANWRYCRSWHRRETIEGIAGDFVKSVVQIIDHCLSSEESGYAPADFPEANVNRGDIEEMYNQVEFE